MISRCRAAWLGAVFVVAAGCEVPLGPTKDSGVAPVSEQNHLYFPLSQFSTHALNKPTKGGRMTCESCHTDVMSFLTYSCDSCHEHRRTGHDADDGSGGMDDAHAGIANYRYESRWCLDCHPTGTAGELGRAEHPSFPISLGTGHELIGCAECHPTESRANVTCTGCHRDANKDSQFDHDVAPMVAVHGSDMVGLGYAWETAACLGCHPAAQEPGLLAHGGEFPIDAGTVHANLVCADCHPSRQDHGQVVCIPCHQGVADGGLRDVHGQARMAEEHADGGLPGYQWESGSCYLCHRHAQVPGEIQHDTLFPIGPTSRHALGSTTEDTPPVEITCATCHVEAFGSAADGGQSRGAGNLRNIDCTQCHAHAQEVVEGIHGYLPDYQWQSSACIFCHIGGATKLDHTAFPLDAGTTHELGKAIGDPAVTVTCNSCHVSKIQLKLLSCTSCHRHDAAQSTLDHGAQMTSFGYKYDSGACFACHRTSQVPGLFDHEPIWKLQPPSGNGRHALLECGDCHPSKTDRKGSLRCAICHQSASTGDSGLDAHARERLEKVHEGIADYQWSPVICIGCHLDGSQGSGRLHLSHIWFPIAPGAYHALGSGDGGTGIACSSCHPTKTAEGDMNFTGQAINCTDCHLPAGVEDGGVHGPSIMNAKHSESKVPSYDYRSAACLDCHPIGESSGVFSHSNFPIASGAKHAGMECSECHLGSGPKTDPTQLNCYGCHNTKVNTAPKLDEIHHGVPGYGGDSAGCFNCHPHSERVGPIDHTRSFPVAVGDKHASSAYLATLGSGQTSCTACHASRADRTQVYCKSCHGSLKFPKQPRSAHSMMSYADGKLPDCVECHADPTPVYRLINHPKPGYDHKEALCDDCHQKMRLDKTYAIDFSKAACSCRNSRCHVRDDQYCR